MCPWNEKFSQALTEPAYAARAAFSGRDARMMAREILSMDENVYRQAFSGSPMKRAKLRGLKRNAAVVLGNGRSPDDAEALSCALDDPEPLVSEHAAWALAQLRR